MNPYSGFIIIATIATITFLILRWVFNVRLLLWKGTLISYIIYLPFSWFMYIDSIRGMGMSHFSSGVFSILSPILIIPGMLIYALIPGVIKPCPSDKDVMGWFTFGFLFYALVIWGIMKIIKKSIVIERPETKQDNKVENETPTETEK